MKQQKLLSLIRQAIEEYHMLEDGDRVAVGVSGGKDSLTLLYAMRQLQRFYPKNFELSAITCNVGFEGMDFTGVSDFCDSLKIPYEQVDTKIAEIVFQENPEIRPCSLCAKLRKGAMYKRLAELGINKIAYAHNKDDFIETALMSLIYEGRFYAFPPVTHLDRSNLDVIRPLMYVPEVDVIGFKNHYNLPVVKNPCTFDGKTQRQYAKDLLQQLNKEHPGVKNRLFTAIINGNIPDWRAIS